MTYLRDYIAARPRYVKRRSEFQVESTVFLGPPANHKKKCEGAVGRKVSASKIIIKIKTQIDWINCVKINDRDRA